MEKTSIANIGHGHSEWLESLDFYKQELGTLKERLTEIGGKNTGHDVALQLEQYENRFKVQRDNIDRLRHNIKENRNALSRQVQENSAGYVERELEGATTVALLGTGSVGGPYTFAWTPVTVD